MPRMRWTSGYVVVLGHMSRTSGCGVVGTRPLPHSAARLLVVANAVVKLFFLCLGTFFCFMSWRGDFFVFIY